MIYFTPKSTKYERIASKATLNTWKVSHITTNDYSWQFSVYAASNYTLFYSKKGTFKFECFHKKETIQENTIVCIAPSQTFRICNVAGNHCEFYIVEFDSDNFPFFELKKYIVTTASPSDIKIFSDLEDSYNAKDNDYVVDAHLIRILHNIQEALKISPQKRLLADKIRKYIREHIGENLTANDIATAFGYNKDYLSRILQKDQNMTLKNMLIEEKLRVAKSLLVFTDSPISMISAQLGFPYPIDFHKFFKYHTKTTPTNYRMTRAK